MNRTEESPPPPPPRSLALSRLISEEAELSNSLSALIADQEPVLASLARLRSLLPRVDELHAEASALTRKVSVTARTAERIGGRVRTLDEEMRRVREAGDRVQQVMELKVVSSLSALQSSIDAQDWESATRHCARAMALPEGVVNGAFAESAVPSSENPLPPAQTLRDARTHLLRVFTRQFTEATKARDAVATTRFFKLFPVIGRETEGLEAYASFVVDLVKRPPRCITSPPLTALFESIAMIVDQHQPVVESYYGTGKMASVIARLLQECDRVCNGLIDGWEEERAVKRKLAEVTNPSFPLASPSPTAGRRPVSEEDVNPRDIDKVISEAAGMAGRWSLFKRFLVDRLKDDSDDEGEDSRSPVSREERSRTASPGTMKPPDSSQHTDLLSNYYTPLEVWYMRSAVDKAHRLSTPDMTSSPTTTTTPDDAFYIFKVVFSRLLSTGAPKVVERTAGALRSVIESDYAGTIRRKMDDVYRNAGVGRGEKVERESRTAFIILLNDLDVSASHMDRLVKDLLTSPVIPQTFPTEEVEGVRASISSFLNIVPKFQSTLRVGVEQLFNQLLRPKLRTLLVDVYKDVPYVLDEEAYAAAEYQDVVRKRFVKAWEGLSEGYKDTLTENNYRLFFGLALDVLIRPWEKLALSQKYNELGAVRFDRDLRAITTYLSSQTAFGDVREKFEEDVDEFYNGSGITWKLSEQDARMVAELRQ
ncbi:COG4-domain-containing protein [Russula earlei]|uniref:COG4-domain-containing protein n=1 Tax=Russula earlei TaxID=71964 RepID=A0ACC0UF84_9AGAM|nr:COG4-domain-containing protein [Russula earlei]